MKRVWCFDLWRTLIEPTEIVAQTYADVLVDLGVARGAIFPFVRDYCMVRKFSYYQLANAVCANFCIEKVSSIRAVRSLWQKENQHIRWISNAQSILKRIRQQGNVLVLITNTTQPGWIDADRILNISPLFDRAFLSFEQKLIKPDPRVFKRVMSWFKEFTPEQFVMVGDSIEHDIVAPEKLNWKTILTEKGIDHVLD